MRIVLALSFALFAAACGSKSPAPAAPAADEETAADEPAEDEGGEEEGGPYLPEECDQYCADGCNEVEEYELCRQDCGCSATPEE